MASSLLEMIDLELSQHAQVVLATLRVEFDLFLRMSDLTALGVKPIDHYQSRLKCEAFSMASHVFAALSHLFNQNVSTGIV